MYTTNTASAGMASTYQTLADECRRLAEIAADLARFAAEHPNFQEALEFAELKTALRDKLIAAHSLAII